MPRPPKDEPAKNIIVRDDASIKWGNGLVSGKWSLTLNEFRLILALTSQLDRKLERFETYQAPIADIGHLMGLDGEGTHMYRDINAAAKSVLRKALEFRGSNGSWVGTPWFALIAYDSRTSTLKWRFNDILIPMLLNLRKSYVMSALEPFRGFKSSYTGRWYLLARQWLKLGTVTLAVDDLRQMFETGKKYKDYNRFYCNVVALPVSELNALSEYHIDITQIKTGRKYTHLRISVTRAGKSSRIPQEETQLLIDTLDISDIDEPST